MVWPDGVVEDGTECRNACLPAANDELSCSDISVTNTRMRRIHLPPLQTLRAFETPRACRASRAADELALTQGAVSQHIRALEAQLGYPLFTRERNGATPTHAAHARALQVRWG